MSKKINGLLKWSISTPLNPSNSRELEKTKSGNYGEFATIKH